jgi:hypothetical protein
MRNSTYRRPYAFLASLFCSLIVNAQTVVSESDIARQPENTQPTRNWVGYTRTGTPPTALQFVEGPGNPPLGCGSLLLTTLLNGEKVFLFNFDHQGKKLSEIGTISYSTYRIAEAQPQAVASINVVIEFDVPGGGKDTATLVFEPVYSPEQGPVVNNTWQSWIASGEGVWWSTEPINGQCKGAVPQCYRSWDEIVADNPDATVIAVGINQGSGNPGLVSAVDNFTFDGSTYNFEPSSDSDGDGSGDACDKDDDNDGVPDAYDCAPLDAKNDKVIVCHNGHEICVSQSAVPTHLKHGDQLGPCTTSTVMPTQPARNNRQEEPAGNQLFGNTPNPFNGTTVLTYSLAADSRVSLKVFDIMGREVATVVDAQKKAGRHTAAFKPEGLQQGVYFYRIIAVSGGKIFKQTRSMLLRR